MIRKIAKKVAPIILSFTIGFNFFSLRGYAGTVLPYNFQTTLSNIGIYYSSTYGNYHGMNTMRGALQWGNNDLLDFLFFRKVTTSSDSSVFCTMFSNSTSAVIAETTFYYGSTQISPYARNWDNCKIRVNHAKTVTYSTLTHEFGHVLGLDENNSTPTSIMCQLAYGRTATAPSNADCILVYRKYSPYVG